MPNPLISVIVPIYNVAPYLRKCLDSLKNQTMNEIEVVCIDDGSTDTSGEIAEEYKNGEGWPIFRVIALFVGIIKININTRIILLLQTHILHISGSLFAFFLLQELANRIQWKSSKFFKSLIKYSMPIYLFHQPVIYFVIYFLNGKLAPILIVITSFIVSFVASYVISAFLANQKNLRVLIGFKGK